MNYKFIEYFKRKEEKNYWDFLDKKDKPIDLIAQYPAKMVSDMQGEIIKEIIKDVKIESIFDPFMGSGTILTESIILGIPNIIGNDINPFSYLITKVKTTKLNSEYLNKTLEILIKDVKNEKLLKIRYFKKITKWFTINTIHELSKILNQIEKIENNDVKDFFSLAFSSLVKSVSNSRTSTFKLHIKASEKIIEVDNVLERFKKISQKQIDNCNDFWNSEKFNNSKIKLYNYDLKELKLNEKIDLIVTSPPYGDNKTTVTYGEFSILQLKWLGYDNKYTENYSAIDSLSLGGKLCKKEEITDLEIYKISSQVRKIVDLLLKETDCEKAKKVITFMQDFFDTLKILKENLKNNGLIVLTVGNRKVNNNEIFFNKIIDEMVENINLTKVIEFSRNLPSTKKIATRTSKLANGKSVESMSKEYVLIYKK